MSIQSFISIVVIRFVNLYADKLKAEAVSRDSAASASEVRVKDSITLFGISLQYPFVERNRLLTRVYARVVLLSDRRIIEQFGVCVK